ncbi:MAG: hypothetical protein M1830_002242 [Pleopsidium flavum]|nr:MAG: hypothetical protein M1830_002242 [Pleopsidium flavum]
MLVLQSRLRYSVLLLIPTLLVILSIFSLRTGFHHKVITNFKHPPLIQPATPPPAKGSEATPGLKSPEEPPHPRYKPPTEPPIPIVDNFPLAANAKAPSDLPPIPSWNRPPRWHVAEKTPLFIGFTRNWLLLQQTIVSYITAGWPPKDIYVIENTGTMDANRRGRLSLQNPFYIDYHRLENVLGVNIIPTPTLLTFAQLQNFYLYTAIEKDWDHYFWGHMDVIALAAEDISAPYKSLYMRTVEILRRTLAPDYAPDDGGSPGKWSIRFFAYDRLALVNTRAFVEVGGWDTMIPFYGTDCDMHTRLSMAGFKQEDANVGLIYDVSTSVPDLGVLYRRVEEESKRKELENTAEHHSRSLLTFGSQSGSEEDELNSSAWHALVLTLDRMQEEKQRQEGGRNMWQSRQAGGQGEPYYRDAAGFEKAIEMTIDFGRQVMSQKWGHHGCDLIGAGLNSGDAWRVEPDWERPIEKGED